MFNSDIVPKDDLLKAVNSVIPALHVMEQLKKTRESLYSKHRQIYEKDSVVQDFLLRLSSLDKLLPKMLMEMINNTPSVLEVITYDTIQEAKIHMDSEHFDKMFSFVGTAVSLSGIMNDIQERAARLEIYLKFRY